jgi:hypothetical protein
MWLCVLLLILSVERLVVVAGVDEEGEAERPNCSKIVQQFVMRMRERDEKNSNRKATREKKLFLRIRRNKKLNLYQNHSFHWRINKIQLYTFLLIILDFIQICIRDALLFINYHHVSAFAYEFNSAEETYIK